MAAIKTTIINRTTPPPPYIPSIKIHASKLWQSVRQTNSFYTNSFHHRSTRRLNGPLILERSVTQLLYSVHSHINLSLTIRVTRSRAVNVSGLKQYYVTEV